MHCSPLGDQSPSGAFQAMAEFACANPLLILDELEKGSTLHAQNGSLWATLISMLQSRGEIYDSCLMANIQIGPITFLATANDVSGLPPALRDRFATG